MLLVSRFLTSPYMDKPRPYPRPAVEIEQTAATAPANSAPDVQAQAVQTKPTNAGLDAVAVGQATIEKSKHLKVARAQTRRDVAQRDDLGRNGPVRNDLARKEDTAGRR